MSTPLSVDSPPIQHIRTDSEQKRDMQEKIQRMIALQNYSNHREKEDETSEGLHGENFAENEELGSSSEGQNLGLTKRTITEMANLNSMLDASPHAVSQQKSLMGNSLSGNQAFSSELPPQSPHSGIGRGTLVFPSTFDPRRRVSSSGDDALGMLGMNMPASNQSAQQAASPPRQVYTGYGALSTTMDQTNPDMQLQQDPATTLQQHEFHYGNPDLHNPEDDEQITKQHQSNKSLCGKLCCLYAPLVKILRQENVSRSFCYASIDGTLTGSGIVSAFCALRVLSQHTSWEVRLAVVVFTTAACTADSICMAMGHVWTSFVMTSGHSQERTKERQLLETNKADSKARLVDMLLFRGMLKIDAMSLADTLEGYPDMLVSALLGDSLFSGLEHTEDDIVDVTHPSTWRESQGSAPGNFLWNFPSYGQFNEMDHEPETGHVNAVWNESRVEGLFMMLGFTFFAVIPSILWLVLPHILRLDAPVAIESTLSTTGPSTEMVISLPTLVTSISGIIIWLLGVWKSRFLENVHWAMSGIENVIVLLACVLSAYGVGFLFCCTIGDKDGLLLTNSRHH